MAKVNIDLEKLICSVIEGGFYSKPDILKALKDQGIEYKDGSLHYIGKEKVKKPKFKEGDWIVYTGYLLKDSGKDSCIMQIESVENGRYNFTDSSILCFDSEKDMRLWTIYDANPEDILISAFEQPFIFKGLTKDRFGLVCHAYGGIEANYKFSVCTHKNSVWTDVYGVKPATEDQEKILFAKMKEAGYKWNSDTLTLEKIEKPATIKFEEEPKKKVHLEDLDVDDDELRTRIKELIHQNEATFGLGYWDKETIEQLHKETDEVSKELNEVLRKAIFWKEPDFDDMILKAEMKYQLSPDALGLYRKGLEDMWKYLKGK